MKKAVPTLNRRTQVVNFFTDVAKILNFDAQKIEETIAYQWLEGQLDTEEDQELSDDSSSFSES